MKKKIFNNNKNKNNNIKLRNNNEIFYLKNIKYILIF